MDFSFTIWTVYLITFLVVSYMINTYMAWTSDFPMGKFPPGPRTLPVIGNLHMIDLKRPNITLMELSKKYGPIFRIQMGSIKMVVLCGYETVKHALVDYADEFSERPFVNIFEDINLGYGITFAHGESWKAMRKFTLSTLRDLGMGKRTIEERIIEESRYLIKVLESLEGKPTDLTTIIVSAVSNIIASIIFGQRFDYKHPSLLRFISIVDENRRLVGSPSAAIYNMFPNFPFFRYMLQAPRRVNQNMAELRTFLTSQLVEHRKILDKDNQRGYIDAFLIKQQQEESDPMTYFHEKNLRGVINNLFTAGTDTTSSTLCWAISFMIANPDIQRKVHEEIDRVIGSAVPRLEHRKDVPYINAVIHETQRFANIVPMNLPRATTRDIMFRGYFLPKGTYIIPFLESVLFDKTQFEKPESFYPEHFLDSDGKFVKKSAFLPFSAGRRSCAGETLAQTELFMFFTCLMQKFFFHPSPDVTEFQGNASLGVTTYPARQKICCIPRF